MGAQLIKEAASKTNDIAGDGTTTATVLAQAIIKEGLKNVAAGANPMIIKRGLAKGVEAVVEEVRVQAKQIRSQDEIAQIAAISANDTQIGELIGEVMDKVGKDGAITVEESKGLEFEIEYVEGMKFDRGLHLAVLRDQPGPHGIRDRGRIGPCHRQEAVGGERHSADAGEGHAGR